jgi:hypothetical protein
LDIESILDSLGLDLTNPEVKKGAIEAISAILDSRAPSMPGGDFGSGGGQEQDIEIDPDLLQPSIKNKPQEQQDDVEINDEDDVLNDLKFNDSDDPQESSMSNETEAGDSADSSSESADNSDAAESDNKSTSNSEGESDNNSSEEGAESEDDSEFADSDSGTSTETDSDDEEDKDVSTGSSEGEEDSDGEESASSETDEDADENSVSTEESEADDDADESDFESDSGNGEETEASEEEADDENELDIDEDDLLDDNIKNAYDDKEQSAKHEARKIKRERTLQAAKKTLDDARAKNKAPALIRELEKAIEALESLQEAVAKNLRDMSDEEFNLIVNRVFDAIDALGDSDLTYTSDEERKIKAKEIKADMEDKQTQAELSAEDVAKIRAETQAIKAREKEKAKYAPKARGSFKGFQDFLNSLYRAIALQVHTEETRDDSWSAISRRNVGAGVLQQGKKLNELPNKKIPVIDFYFDQSGSWDEDDIKVGEKAVAALAEMEEKGQIKINIYYFANHVHSDAASARYEGGTWAWNDIVKNVIATQATNVIIMTDSDMEDRWDYEGYWHGTVGKAAAYTVPGYVWYLWRGGDNAPRLPRDLKGRGGTQQFSFNSGDI